MNTLIAKILPFNQPFGKELIKVSVPLMLSYLSMVGMMFIDRLFLARYSLDALNAFVSSGMLAYSLTFGLQTLTLIASVFVSQLNGAKKYSQLGEPVWQMVWLSVFSVFLLLPLIFLAGNLFYVGDDFAQKQALVFRGVILITPLYALHGAVMSFFNGQGKTKIVTYLSILGNLVNAILDPIFIFGWGPIPSLGIKGAITATAIGLIVQIAIFFYLFLSTENREKYGATKWQLQPKLFYSCCKVGTPEAFGVGVEIFIWGIFYNIMALLSPLHTTIASVANSVVMLFVFFGIGLEQGASVLAGNLIGANQVFKVDKVFRVGCLLVWWNGLLIILLFACCPDIFIGYFFSGDVSKAISDVTEVKLAMTEGYKLTRDYLVWLGVYLAFENFRWLTNGILRAGGDTLFLLLSNAINTALFMILPSYILLFKFKYPPETFFYIWPCYAVLGAFISYARYMQGKWREMVII